MLPAHNDIFVCSDCTSMRSPACRGHVPESLVLSAMLEDFGHSDAMHALVVALLLQGFCCPILRVCWPMLLFPQGKNLQNRESQIVHIFKRWII